MNIKTWTTMTFLIALTTIQSRSMSQEVRDKDGQVIRDKDGEAVHEFPRTGGFEFRKLEAARSRVAVRRCGVIKPACHWQADRRVRVATTENRLDFGPRFKFG